MKRSHVLIVLPLLGMACGQTTTLGNEKSGGGDSGIDADAESGATAGGGSAAAGAGGLAGGGTGGGFGGSVGGDAASSTCDIALPAPLVNPTPEQLERAKLIHDYCTSVVQQCPDSGFWLHAQGQCSPAELVIGCEQDTLEQYLVGFGGCETEWKTWIVCAANATYASPDECSSTGPGNFVSGTDIPCMKEKLALGACFKANWKSVTGAYTTCSYGPSSIASCNVMCLVGPNTFDLACYAQPGLPLLCSCTVNGNFINQDFGLGGNFYATDCADAAKRAADGQCTNRLECCFEYNDGKNDLCMCGSDPKLLNMPTCQAAADSGGGKVVDICPQYQSNHGGCWPPGACG